MLQAQVDSVAVSGTQVGRRLVGNWTLYVKPPVTKHVVPMRLELSPIEAVGRLTLVCVWTLQA